MLLEKKFLSYYSNIYKSELLLYVLVGNVIFYMAAAFTLRMFSRNVALGMLIPGMTLNIYCIYARTMKMKQYDLQL